MRSRLQISPSLAISCVALFVALGGTAYAATGGGFILGVDTNTADHATGLTANLATAPTLQLTNGSGAPAASFTTTSSAAPFSVSSKRKVTKLNADTIDGIDSTALVAGSNTRVLSNRMVLTPGAAEPTILTLPGLGYVTVRCGVQWAELWWHNDTGGTVDLWTDNIGYVSGIGALRRFAVGGATYPTDQGPGLLGLGAGNDPGPRTIATMYGYALQTADNAPCGFQVQATVWNS